MVLFRQYITGCNQLRVLKSTTFPNPRSNNFSIKEAVFSTLNIVSEVSLGSFDRINATNLPKFQRRAILKFTGILFPDFVFSNSNFDFTLLHPHSPVPYKAKRSPIDIDSFSSQLYINLKFEELLEKTNSFDDVITRTFGIYLLLLTPGQQKIYNFLLGGVAAKEEQLLFILFKGHLLETNKLFYTHVKYRLADPLTRVLMLGEAQNEAKAVLTSYADLMPDDYVETWGPDEVYLAPDIFFERPKKEKEKFIREIDFSGFFGPFQLLTSKGRFSRNRQTYRSGVLWCVFLTVFTVYFAPLLFYTLIPKLSYLWWLAGGALAALAAFAYSRLRRLSMWQISDFMTNRFK